MSNVSFAMIQKGSKLFFLLLVLKFWILVFNFDSSEFKNVSYPRNSIGDNCRICSGYSELEKIIEKPEKLKLFSGGLGAD